MKFFFPIFLLYFTHGLAKNYKNKENLLHKEPPRHHADEISNDVIYYGFFPMKVNNFDPMDNRTFGMRYFMNKDFLEEDSPIFLFIGGEWAISDVWLRTGHMYDMAKSLNGVMFYTEHRYYGQSRPTENLELENLQWLSVDQALADLSNFIIFIKDKFPEISNSKVILVGCSYSASIATWFMQKYPHLAAGAWAMSGPLYAKLDFAEYKEVVSKAIHNIGGENCSNRIKNGFLELEQLISNSRYEEVETMLRLCTPLNATNSLDVWSIFHDMANVFAGIVQYASRRGQEIEKNCRELLAIDSETEAEALAKWILIQWNKKDDDCYDNRWSTFLQKFNGTKWTDWVANVSWRQWLYQSCTEFAWFQSSSSEHIIFGSSFPPEVFLQFCIDLYDETFSYDFVQNNVERTNTIYGDFQPSAHHVYSTHGEYDPWHPVGIDIDISEDSPTVILPGESHCADLASISEWDTPEMRASKEKVFELIKKWIGHEG